MQREITRRLFLKGAALSAAAFPRIVPATALGAAGAAPPSDRIVMGFIGVGKMGGGHVGGFAGRGEVQIVAVCDVEEPKRENAKKTVEDRYARRDGGGYKGCASYKDFRDLLARDEIDAVLIATPDHWHAIASIESARAGKDIYCEKPLSL
ncbi:MAG: Gfo/Idh/MocA family oxidoreductase, partial [Planctomycetes bacterium]|nr:Gfo/Idh/MocA family oxidoreductase [Planctomycetota bacterium]